MEHNRIRTNLKLIVDTTKAQWFGLMEAKEHAFSDRVLPMISTNGFHDIDVKPANGKPHTRSTPSPGRK